MTTWGCWGWDTGVRFAKEVVVMGKVNVEQKLARYNKRYADLAAQLTQVGFVASGSLLHRYTKCGTPACRCHQNPPKLHGPYWQLTFKRDGKTVTRHLTPGQATLYKKWLTNDRRHRRLVEQMRAVAAKATELMLEQAKTPPTA